MTRCAVCRTKTGFRKSVCARCMYFRTVVAERGLDWALASLRAAEILEKRSPHETRETSLLGKVGTLHRKPSSSNLDDGLEGPAMESKSVGRSATDARLFSGGSSYHDVVAVGAVAAPKPTIVKPKATTANPFASETGGNAAVKDGSDTVTNEPLTSIAKPPVRISFGTAVAAAKPAHVSPPKVQVVEQEIPDRYIVRHPFEPDHPKQLRLVLEDILTVQQRLDSGWWSVTNQNDESGWCPSGYLRPLVPEPKVPALLQNTHEQQGESTSIASSQTEMTEQVHENPVLPEGEGQRRLDASPGESEDPYSTRTPPPKLSTPAGDVILAADSGPNIYVATHDYQAQNSKQISFAKGALLRATRRSDNGWWQGELYHQGIQATGGLGWFPSTFVKPHNLSHDTGADKASSPAARTASATGSMPVTAGQVVTSDTDLFVVKHAWQKQVAQQMSLLKKDLVRVTKRLESGWWQGEKLDADSGDKVDEGWFPMGYVIPAPSSASVLWAASTDTQSAPSNGIDIIDTTASAVVTTIAATPSPVQLRKRTSEIVVDKVGGSLGIVLAGGKGTQHGDLGIFVSQIVAGGGAAKEGTLAKWDEIVAVDDTSLLDLTLEETTRILQATKNTVHLTIRKGRQAHFLQSLAIKQSNKRAIKIEKLPGESLGIRIAGGVEKDGKRVGIRIQKIHPSGSAARNGQLSEGDEILAVNNTDFRNVTHSQAVTVLRDLSDDVTIVIKRCVSRRQTYNPGMLRNEGRRHETIAAPAQVSLCPDFKGVNHRASAADMTPEAPTLPSLTAASTDLPLQMSPMTRIAGAVDRTRPVKVTVSALHASDDDDSDIHDSMA